MQWPRGGPCINEIPGGHMVAGRQARHGSLHTSLHIFNLHLHTYCGTNISMGYSRSYKVCGV